MSSLPKKRERLVEELLDAGRAGSTLTVMFHTAIASRLGLSVSDYKALDVLVREGPLSAGALGRVTGLSTGAVTGLIDRLERARLARRRPDSADRRKVMVEATVGDLESDVLPMFASFSASLAQMLERFTAKELAVIVDYTRRLNEVLEAEVGRLVDDTGQDVEQGAARSKAPGRTRSA